MNQYKENRKELFKLLKDNSMVLLSSGKANHKTQDQFFPFQVNKMFFYFTGVREPNCTLLLVKGNKKTHEFMFIEETTEFMKKWVGENISKEEVNATSEINQTSVLYNAQFDSMIKNLMSEYDHFNVGELNQLYLDLYRVDNKTEPIAFTQFKDVINNYKELNIKNLNEHASYLRMFKSVDEVEKIREAIAITNQGLNRIMRELPKRDNESQINADFEHEINLNGAEGVAFDTILASGVNGCILHYEDNNSDLNKDDLLLCDLGASYNEYGADISRTYPVSGTFSDRQKEIYEIVLKCNKECIEYAKAGITLGDLHKKSREILSEECMRIGLISSKEEISKYYYHSVTHFLGLDTHDVGYSKLPLEPGMMFTVEPGLYIKEEGIGVRIEDDILITEDGRENLSKNIIKEVSDIEKYMSKNAK